MQKSYEFQYGEYGQTTGVKINVKSLDVLRYNFINKGTAFTTDEREKLKLSGILPPRVKTLREQIATCRRILDEKENDLERFIYLRGVYDRNVGLVHAVIASDLPRFLRIIYTPTVGEACRNYSYMFRGANGIHFYPGNIDRAEEILRNYTQNDIRVAVVTDNQGILGIGDQGAGGIAICLGKLKLYSQGAGIAPWHCLPISLDVGTDNPEHLKDENYLGWRHERIKGDDYFQFVENFVRQFKRVFPHALCQWEDFSKQNAFTVRDAFREEILSFNDDIQGTGAVTLAGILAAMKIKREKLSDQVFCIHGAGAGGIGIAEQIKTELCSQGLEETEAKQKIITLDSKGVVTIDRVKEGYKRAFAKDPQRYSWLRTPDDNTLLNVVKNEKVTVLIGTSGQPGCFDREIIQAMLGNSNRPIILPLSNPTTKAEITPEDIYHWTGGKALTAAGSPFSPVLFGGKANRIGQMNNVFIFPGIGLGVLAAGAKEIAPSFFSAAAHAVAESVDADDLHAGILCPPLEKLRDVSLNVAKRVAEEAVQAGLSRECAFCRFEHLNDPERLNRLIDKMRWKPGYIDIL